MDRVKVLYIAGWGRSGSTLISSVLGSVPGFFAAGELAFLWAALHHREWRCSCRSLLTACPVWQQVLEQGLGEVNPDTIRAMHLGVDALLNKKRYGWRVLGRAVPPDESGRPLLGRLEHFYGAMRDVTRARMIVDSSKVPLYATWLHEMPSIDLYVLHLVRDPRAVAYSWSRPKDNMSGSGSFHIPHRSTVQSALRWSGVNQVVELMRRRLPLRYMRLRYTDFVRQPRQELEKVLHFVGEPAAENPIREDRTIELTSQHIAFGNPDRMQHGTIHLAPRNEWRDHLPAFDRRVVTLLCSPLMMRYGYSLAMHGGRTPMPAV